MKDRIAREEIAQMNGPTAIPRKSGEMVFHDDWEKRAFAIAVSLAEQGLYEWGEFQQQLIEAITEAERDDPLKPTRGYYESWVESLEAVLDARDLLRKE